MTDPDDVDEIPPIDIDIDAEQIARDLARSLGGPRNRAERRALAKSRQQSPSLAKRRRRRRH